MTEKMPTFKLPSPEEWIAEYEDENGNYREEEIEAPNLESARERVGDLIQENGYRRGTLVGRKLKDGTAGTSGDGRLTRSHER